jgi:arabinogalactan endo-1,4-beta-galactosidase
MAKRIAAAGMQLVIDFHYSDTWADPGHQTTPAAWTSLDHAHLVNEVYQYTEAFISGLVAQGTPPMAVQIGNEITNGMLWPDGYLDGTSGQWQNFADLVNAGIAGVRAAQGSRYISVMIHIDRGGDNAGAESFFDNLIAYGVQFDVIGLSYYVWWQGPISDMESNTWALALRYVKPIVIAETMYPSTLNLVGDWSRWVTEDSQIDSRFPASAAGQGSYVESVMSTIADLPMGLGLGTLYWAPEGIDDPVNTQPFDNLVLFDFYGNELSSMEAMGGQFSFTTSASDVNNRGQLYATITIPFPDPLGKTSFGLFSADPTLIGVPSRARFTSGQTTWTVPLTVGAASKPTEVPIFVYRCGTAKACTVTVHPN